MGQCMSRKAAGAFAASAAGAHSRPSKKKHSKLHESPDDNQKSNDSMKKNGFAPSKGVASSFGFKRRPLTAPSALTTPNQAVGRRLAFNDTDSNGNDKDTKSLTANFHTNGRSTPRLPPPKKEGNATQGVGRFGFRQTNLQVNRSNRVADLNAEQLGAPRGSSTPRTFLTSSNAASQNKFTQRDVANRTPTIGVDKNRNRTVVVKTPGQSELIGRFTLQTNQLPKPQSVRVMSTKTAKTIANNNMKFASSARRSPEDGFLTEDSGLGSHVGTDFDICPQTPVAGKIRHRNLEVMVNGNTFELREPDDNEVPLPKLPSATCRDDSDRSYFPSTGVVKERTFAYEQQIETEIKRKISATSSEGFSDEANSQHKPQMPTQKSFLKPKPSPIKSFLKAKVIENKEYSSASSEDIEYGLGGEALAEELSISMSSSDESKDKDMRKPESENMGNVARLLSEDKMFLKKSLQTLPLKQEFRPVTLTIAEPTMEAAAEDALSVRLLEDETSPVDDSLLSFTESEEGANKKNNSSDSKDINEKPSASTPSTLSNESNSFTLPDDKDFLIDDEIADQPALLGDKSQRSESTLIDSSTPLRRRKLKSFENSPVFLKDKCNIRGSNVSLDTLSPCESIGSDDMMLDFDCSHSSIDEDKLAKLSSKKIINFDESHHSINSLETDIKNNEQIRDWSALLNGSNDKHFKSSVPRTRFLRSRTPSSICDSHSSLDGRSNGRISTPSGSLRRFAQTTSQGYDSDDSYVKLDRTAQAAIKNDISEVKTMLFKLRGFLTESETRNPFEDEMNGHSNGSPEQNGLYCETESVSDRFEVVDLRRQILFLQGQLEDKEKKVMSLQEQITKMSTDNYLSNSAPASTVGLSKEMNNAATQTDRVRRLLTETLTNCSQATQGNLVSVIESLPRNYYSPQKSTHSTEAVMSTTHQPISKPPTMIPRRAESRSRVVPSSLS